MKENTLFNLGNIPVSSWDLLILISLFIIFISIFFIAHKFIIPFLNKKEEISQVKQQKGKLLFILFLIFLYIDIFIIVLDIEFLIFNQLSMSILVESAILLVLSYLFLWIASNVFINKFIHKRLEQEHKIYHENAYREITAIKSLKWLLFSFAILIMLNYTEWDYTLWTIKSPKDNAPNILIRFSSIINTMVIYLIANLSTWAVNQIILAGYFRKRQFDDGISYSINKLIAYLFYFVATLVALRTLGMDMGILLGGTAALLVGVGLALQNTFSDFFAGLILLFERPVKVGDFVTFEGNTVKVQKIGLRASKVKNRNNINYIIPNSKMIVNSVINWSHDEKTVRFQVKVGVAYGSDTALVKKILLEVADSHKEILKRPKPVVLFSDFADSALEFIINYHSNNIFNAELIKSDLRFEIDRKFRENNILIPFPQRDVWMKS